MKKYKEFMNEDADEQFDLFDDEIEVDNEKFLVYTGVDGDEITITIERYNNPDDNDTEVVSTVFYEIYDDQILKNSGVEVAGDWGKKNRSKIKAIINKEFDGAEFYNEKDVMKSLNAAVKNLTKIY